MRDLMTEINTLFELCENANTALRSVDGRTQHTLMTKIQKQSQMVFVLLENAVNPMGKKDLLKEIPKDKCESKVIEWIKNKKKDNSEESAIAFLNFSLANL